MASHREMLSEDDAQKLCSLEQTSRERSGTVLGYRFLKLWAHAAEEAFPQMATLSLLFCSALTILSTFFFLLVRIGAKPSPLPPALVSSRLVSSRRITVERYAFLPYKVVR